MLHCDTKKPNKALEPTRPLVTGRAAARPAPSGRVAHLTLAKKMAFDEKLASSVRTQIGRKSGVAEKRMFGGVAFLSHGNMAVGIHREELVVRIAPELMATALREEGVRPFDITGRPMKGWLLVGGEAVARPESVAAWIS